VAETIAWRINPKAEIGKAESNNQRKSAVEQPRNKETKGKR
jgi:hypothetical protein